MNPDDFPAPEEGFVITHFLVVADQDRSREFYRSLFGGQVVLERDPVIMKVANTWLILNVGGGPTDDKPDVTLTTPPDPRRGHRKDLPGVVGQRRRVPDRAKGSRARDPRVRPRPRRALDRGGPDNRASQLNPGQTPSASGDRLVRGAARLG